MLLPLLLDGGRRCGALLLPPAAAIHGHGLCNICRRRSCNRHDLHSCTAALAAALSDGVGFAAAIAAIRGQPGQQQVLQQLVGHDLPQGCRQSSLLLLRRALLQPADHLLHWG